MALQWRRPAAVVVVSTLSGLALVLASQPANAAHGSNSSARSAGANSSIASSRA